MFNNLFNKIEKDSPLNDKEKDTLHVALDLLCREMTNGGIRIDDQGLDKLKMHFSSHVLQNVKECLDSDNKYKHHML